MNQFNLGDLIFAAIDPHNDPLEETGESGIPGPDGNLAEPIGCLPEELSHGL